MERCMSGFIEGEDRHQAAMFPERLDDYVDKEGPVRFIDFFIDDLDISGMGCKTEPNNIQTLRPSRTSEKTMAKPSVRRVASS
jgi:hypothetical protein